MKKFFTSIILLSSFLGSKSQAAPVLATTYNLPTVAFPNLDSMINRLNREGITGVGPLIVNLGPTYPATQQAPSGGYYLGSVILNSSTNPIRINGNRRTIIAPSGTGSSDAIFAIIGRDNVTLDSLKFVESAANTTATTMMEWGVAALRLSDTDGVKTLNVENCQITLNKTNATAASGFSPTGSTGIFVGNCTATSTAGVTVTTINGVHDGFYFFNCYISNVTNGIYCAGSKVTADGSALHDRFITASTDTIENFISYGISISNFNLDNVSKCQVNNMNNGGAAPTTNPIYGIRYANDLAQQTNTSWTCADNNINLNVGGTAANFAYGIYSAVYGTGSTDIANDTIQLTSSGTANGLEGIKSENNLGTQTIRKNLIQNFTTTVTTSSNVLGIRNGQTTGLYGYPTSSSIKDNVIQKFNAATTANVYGIVDQSSTTSGPVIDNNLIDNFTITANSITFRGITIGQAAITANTATFSNNTISNITAVGTTTQGMGIRTVSSALVTANLTKNKVRNITFGTGNFAAAEIAYCLAATLDKDTFENITSTGSVYGIQTGYWSNQGVPTINYTNNYINNLTSNSLAGSAQGISIAPGTANMVTSANISNNLISKITATTAGDTAAGIAVTGGTATYNIKNNIIVDVAAAANTTAFSSSFGLSLQSTGTNNVNYNTINLISGSIGTGFGATGILYSPAGSNALKNNIVRVNVTAGTNNNVTAIRATNGTASAAPSLSGFNAASNIYYTPTGPNNFLYVEGTTNAGLVNGFHVSGLTASTTKNIVNDNFFNSTCDKSTYHLFMQGAGKSRESKTATENNLVASAGLYAPTGMSYAESMAVDIPAVGVDFKSDPRPSGVSDIGALQFAGIQLPKMNITLKSSTGLDTACPYNLPTLTASVPSFFKGKVKYQWYRGTTAVTGAKDSTYKVASVSATYFVTVYDTTTGCTDTSAKYKMTVVPPPPAIITYYDSLTFCATSAIVVQANKGVGFTYQWYFNGGVIPGENTDHLVVDKTGEYSLEVNTPLGCATSSTPIRVKVYPNPTPTVAYFGPRMLTTTQKYFLYQWFKNNVKISDTDATNRTLYIKSDARYGDGAYSVEVTDSNGCTAKSETYLFSLGINENMVAAAIKIFPNPATDVLNIESPVTVNAMISDLAGRVIIRQDNAKQLQLGSLSEGLYLLTLSDKDGQLIKVEKINKIK